MRQQHCSTAAQQGTIAWTECLPKQPSSIDRRTLAMTTSPRLHRRAFLQVGGTSLLGIGLPALLAGRAASVGRDAERGRQRSVILVLLTGGASHLDTLDMKPDAPAEIRGEFTSIATSVPGTRICEHL